jgi:hypothetical protein
MNLPREDVRDILAVFRDGAALTAGRHLQDPYADMPRGRGFFRFGALLFSVRH